MKRMQNDKSEEDISDRSENRKQWQKYSEEYSYVKEISSAVFSFITAVWEVYIREK